MKVPARKVCNICDRTVATKYGLRYHTDKYYVTLRSDSCTYPDVGPTVKGEVHICKDCWTELKYASLMRELNNK